MQIMRMLCMLALCCSAILQTSYANEATATDDAAEVAVLAKVIQPNTNTQPQPSVEAQSPRTEAVANDMADGESIRTLPQLNEPVIDQANILSAQQKQQISQRILNIHQQGKAQIGVVIVPTTGQEDIFGFAMRIAESWQLGSAKQDNGLLMAIAVNDRRIQILSGYGLEGVLPDIVSHRIIQQNISPYFQQGRYAAGIESGIMEIEKILNQDPEIAAQAAQELKERQQAALDEQQARQKTTMMALFILLAGVIASYIVGRRLSASTAAVAALVVGLVNGAGLVVSLLMAGAIFVLLISSLAQLIFQGALSGASRGGRGGGGFGGGGFGGGGGGFGGGGASGSW